MASSNPQIVVNDPADSTPRRDGTPGRGRGRGRGRARDRARARGTASRPTPRNASVNFDDFDNSTTPTTIPSREASQPRASIVSTEFQPGGQSQQNFNQPETVPILARESSSFPPGSKQQKDIFKQAAGTSDERQIDREDDVRQGAARDDYRYLTMESEYPSATSVSPAVNQAQTVTDPPEAITYDYPGDNLGLAAARTGLRQFQQTTGPAMRQAWSQHRAYEPDRVESQQSTSTYATMRMRDQNPLQPFVVDIYTDRAHRSINNPFAYTENRPLGPRLPELTTSTEVLEEAAAAHVSGLGVGRRRREESAAERAEFQRQRDELVDREEPWR